MIYIVSSIGIQNHDLIGIVETGSGKTAAFVIPMLTCISQEVYIDSLLGRFGLVDTTIVSTLLPVGDKSHA